MAREALPRRLHSLDHLTDDGTLLEAWASHKSCRARDENRHGLVVDIELNQDDGDAEPDAALAVVERGRRSALDGRTTRHPGYRQS